MSDLGRPVKIRLSADGPEHRAHGRQRQVGWVAENGEVYAMDETYMALHRPRFGSITPIYIDLDD